MASGVLVACAAILDIGDLGVVPDATVAPCVVGGSGSLDFCVADGGVVVLPARGEMHDLALAAVGDASLIGAGFAVTTDGSRLAVQVFSTSGEPGAQTVDVGKVTSTANALVSRSDGVYAVGGGSDGRFMIRHYLGPTLTLQSFVDLKESAAGVALGEVASASPDGTELNMFGTSDAGSLVVMRFNVNTFAEDKSVLVTAGFPLHATSGVTRFTSAQNELTILGDTPGVPRGLAMARFTPDLSKDPTFGDAGLLTLNFGDGGSARAMALDDVGGYWIAGEAGGASGFVLAHVNHNGTLDPRFGDGGILVAPGPNRGANALLVTPQGLLVAGFDHGKMAIARFSADAGLDPAFGDGGVVTLGVDGELRKIVSTGDRFVFGGFAVVGGTTRWALVWMVK